MRRAAAAAKINLALVVGPLRDDGKHELVTVYQRVALSDRIAVQHSAELQRHRLRRRHARAYRRSSSWPTDDGTTFAARIEKRIPVAAGLGGGSSDAATSLRLANELRADPHGGEQIEAFARELGADVPYFLADGPQLGTGDGTELSPLELPQDYWVVLVVPRNAEKTSTGAVYSSFDTRNGPDGYDERSAALLRGLEQVRRPRDLAALPPNDLVSSPLTAKLLALGAFRADVTGAGPAVYGLFLHGDRARAARRNMSAEGRTWLTAPAWYR